MSERIDKEVAAMSVVLKALSTLDSAAQLRVIQLAKERVYRPVELAWPTDNEHDVTAGARSKMLAATGGTSAQRALEVTMTRASVLRWLRRQLRVFYRHEWEFSAGSIPGESYARCRACGAEEIYRTLDRIAFHSVWTMRDCPGGK